MLYQFKVEICPVPLTRGGLDVLWSDSCYCFWLGGVQTTADLLGTKERLDSAGQGSTLQNTKYQHRYYFYSSEMIVHYSARRVREVFLFCCLNCYLAYGFFFSSTASKLCSLFLRPAFFRSLFPSHFIIFCNCST